MTLMIRNTVLALLSKGKRLARTYPRRAIALPILLAIALFFVTSIDFSDRLSADQVALVRAFVHRTNSQAVLNGFNDAVSHGRLTANDADRIIEISKKQKAGYGLIENQTDESQ